MLPEVKKVPLPKCVFPQSWQTVIFRNYGIVSTDKIAKVLECDEARIVKEAARLGLNEVVYDARWEKKGFISIVRANWYLLSYEQLMTLLNYDEQRLQFVLEKEDFLDVKMGLFKPACEKLVYAPLTDEEKAETLRVAKTVQRYVPSTVRPFEFFEDGEDLDGAFSVRKGKGMRIIHGYLTPCGDAFIVDSNEYLPDTLLAKYQRQGINGVWVHGVLSSLSPYPFDPELSKDYELRRSNMKELVARAAKYGIKVYLYINEPRGLPEDKIGKYAHLAGHRAGGQVALCFERKETREYLYNALKDLFTDVKGLGGVITITMSENLTHCNFRTKTNCPVCKNIPAEESAAAVNNVIAKALRDSGGDAKVLAYLWGWSPAMDWTEEQVKRGVALLDKDIAALSASEYDLPIDKGGVKGKVVDYSIFNPGPSGITKLTLGEAAKTGHDTYAKIQTNNSWELSAAPYMPVFDLLLEHLQNLEKIDVHNYMLTWTLGGYPSIMLDLAADFADEPKAFDLQKWYEKHFGENAERVHSAVKKFCAGAKEYPFSVDKIYYGPHTIGPANWWSLAPQENESTMVCFAYDDYEKWTKPYPYEIYVSQFEKLLARWEEGMQELNALPQSVLIKEMQECAETAYIHFKADLLQTKFSYYKRDLANCKAEIADLITQEREITQRLLVLAAGNPAIGFEASNHYYYNDRTLTEKILETYALEEELKNV